jgi:hypothetical protein
MHLRSQVINNLEIVLKYQCGNLGLAKQCLNIVNILLKLC